MKITLPMNRKKTHRLLTLLASTLPLLTGCSTPQTNILETSIPPTPSREPLRFEATGTAFLQEAGQLSQFTSLGGAEFIEASGRGFSAPNATSSSQKKLTALKAARYGALAGLAEELKGLEVTRVARVQDLVFSGEEVSVTISGIIQGASAVKEHYDPESGLAEVRLRIALDKDGNSLQQRAMRSAPASSNKRKAEAEAAARINAAAALREQVGQIFVMQNIQVKNLKFDNQQAQLDVKGLLEGVRFSTPRWHKDQCEVTAVLEIDPTHIK